MAVEDYWASSARIANDLAKYGLYPLAKMLAIATFKDTHKANVVAGVTTAAFYSGLSWMFLGREMDGFDQIARKAVAAELGKRPEEMKFSDFYESENPVIKSRMALLATENRERYSVSALPMLPTMMEYAARGVGPQAMRPARDEVLSGETRWRDKPPAPNSSWTEHMLYGYNLWDGIVFAGIAALWFNETYGIDKTFIYQGRKEMENNQGLGLKIGPNNIAGLYNRMRSDTKLPMVDSKEDREKIWPLYERLAKEVNESSKFDLPELTYLMGMGKLNVFAKDQNGKEIRGADGNLVLDENAMNRALAEIDKVKAIGLAGIARENRELRPKSKAGFVERLERGWMDFQFNSYRGLFGKTAKFQEYVSPRDPGEAPVSIP